MQREAATAAPRRQSTLRTAAIVTICVLGCIAGLSLLVLRQTATQYHHLLEARKDFEATQNALRADLLKQIDETDSLKQQLDAAQRDRKGVRQQPTQQEQRQQQQQQTIYNGRGQPTRTSVPDRHQPSLELVGQAEASAASSFGGAGTQLLAAPSAGTKPAAAMAAAIARSPTLSSSSLPDGVDAATPSIQKQAAQGLPRASEQQQQQAGMSIAQKYPNVANVAYGSARSRSFT